MGRRASIRLRIRTPQADYLEQMARWSDGTISDAFDSILERHASSAYGKTVAQSALVAREERRRFVIDSDRLAFLDRLCVRWGVCRAEAARRLIDMELVGDQMAARG